MSAAIRARTFAPAMVPELVDLWNTAAGKWFPLRERLFRQNAIDDPHFDPAGCIVAIGVDSDRAVGFCLAKVARVPLGADGLRADRGWISMLAVLPDRQRSGIGTALLRAAEAFLRDRGRRRFVLGTGPAHFFPGVPDLLGTAPFFQSCEYVLRGHAYDLWRPLDGYRTPAAVAETVAAHPDLEIRALRPGEEAALLAFLDATFPGAWRYTAAHFLDGGGPIGDFMALVGGGAVLGFAHVFPPDAHWIGPSIAWAAPAGAEGPASKRVGGLGPMGISPALRGRGLGLALLDRAMVHLAAAGAAEMFVDWTVLLDFYGKLGFVPYRRYHHGERQI